MLIVQRNMIESPGAMPVTVEVALVGVVIVPAVPYTRLHTPVPIVGTLPFRVKEVTLHSFWSAPVATVGVL